VRTGATLTPVENLPESAMATDKSGTAGLLGFRPIDRRRAAVRIRVKNTQMDDSAKDCLGGVEDRVKMARILSYLSVDVTDTVDQIAMERPL
jgi:hypothetical protein